MLATVLTTGIKPVPISAPGSEPGPVFIGGVVSLHSLGCRVPKVCAYSVLCFVLLWLVRASSTSRIVVGATDLAGVVVRRRTLRRRTGAGPLVPPP